MTKKNNRRRKKPLRIMAMKAAAFFAVLVIVLNTVSIPVSAEYVTDTLTVRVGYGGMDLTEYVEIGTYHWSELYESLPIYEVPYSYFQKESETTYNAIVDSGRGFYITDLLDWLNIYYGDIYNLQFYVNDHHGIQAAFDRDSLFSERYYFNDLPGHRQILRDPSGWFVTGYDFSDAWTDCEQVEPMLAIEDNWQAMTQEAEHIAPDFEQANPGNRFRLLFGQTEPTEQLTSKSAKYVSCIYVTLYGEPAYSVAEDAEGNMQELDGSLGAHDIEMTVSVDNIYIRDALSELMNITSSDENVLVINGINVELDDTYSDLAHVRISYEVVGKGSATINAGIGSIQTLAPEESPFAAIDNTDLPEDEGTPEDDPPEEPEEQEIPENNDPGNAVTGGDDENIIGDDGPEIAENEDADQIEVPEDNEDIELSDDLTAESSAAGEDTNTGNVSNSVSGGNDQSSGGNGMPRPSAGSSESGDADAAISSDTDSSVVEEVAQIPVAPVVFKISDAVFRNPDFDAGKTQVAAIEDIEQVKAEDRSEERKALEKKVVIGVLIGCLFFMAAGSVFESLYFKRRLRGGKYVFNSYAE